MSTAVWGMIAGMALAFAGYFGGFGALVLVAALGALGFLVGWFFDRGTEAREFFRVRGRERR